MQLNGLPNNPNIPKLDCSHAPIQRKESTDPAAQPDGLALGERTPAEPKFMNAFYDSKTGTVNFPGAISGGEVPFEIRQHEEASIPTPDPNFVPPAAPTGEPAGHTYVAGLSLRSSAAPNDSAPSQEAGPDLGFMFAGGSFASHAGSVLGSFAKELETNDTLRAQMQAEATYASMQRQQLMEETMKWIVSDARNHAADKKIYMQKVWDGYIRP